MTIHADQLYKCTKTVDGVEKYMLRPISFEVGAGEHVLVTGASGSGKTTLLSLIAGLSKPTGGTVTLTGEEGDPENKGVCSMLFQENRLLPELSAVRNIQVVLPKHYAGRRNESREPLEKVIWDHLGRLLPGVSRDKPAAELSGGEKRRVALVRAVLAPGEVLLLDEPFTGLDDASIRNVKEYIRQETEGRTVLLTDHEGVHFPDWRKIHVEAG